MKNNIQTVFAILRELNYILNSKQKKKAIRVFGLIIISSCLELIGVTAVLPFVQAILMPDELMQNRYVKVALDVFGIQTETGLLLFMGICLIFVYIFKNAIILLSHYVQIDYSTRVQKELALNVLRSYTKRPYEYFLNINSSEMLRSCSGDTAGTYNILSNLLSLIAEFLNILLIGMYIVYTDVWMASGVLLLMFIVLLGMVLGLKPMIKRMGIRNREASQRNYKAIQQTAQGIKEIYVMQRKEVFLEEYDDASELYRKTSRGYGFIGGCPDRIVEGVCVSGLIGIVCVRLLLGGDMVAFVPKLAAFAMAAFKVLPSIGKLTSRMNGIVYFRRCLTNLYQLTWDADQYEKEKAEYAQKKGICDDELADIRFAEKLQIRDVVWTYQNQKAPVLSGTELEIKKGEAVGLIGASGAGKTTLADVILGLLKPQEGTVLMDGKDIYAMPKTWARIVGYVPQAVFLMDDTVRNNVAFGMKNIDDEKIWEALSRAQLKEFIEGLPDQLDTIVGERGVKFSGGQRQRISIARALYNEPEILVMDEATAALDNETETAVMESIDALQGQITMIIVAHRLTTIKNCDRIYEIVDGKAVERRKEEIFS